MFNLVTDIARVSTLQMVAHKACFLPCFLLVERQISLGKLTEAIGRNKYDLAKRYLVNGSSDATIFAILGSLTLILMSKGAGTTGQILERLLQSPVAPIITHKF